jgi:hypothetical protein
MHYQQVLPMWHDDSSFLYFVQRMPDDIRPAFMGISLNAPVGDKLNMAHLKPEETMAVLPYTCCISDRT